MQALSGASSYFISGACSLRSKYSNSLRGRYLLFLEQQLGKLHGITK
jgi:hypothetical protein